MQSITRRSVLCSSFGLTTAGILARPYVANAAATTVETWWNQGYLPEEDVSFRALVADYQKASGNKIDYSLIPNAPLRQKEISAIQSGGVPDVMRSPIFGLLR
jgi:multiple sugar transport system substrate-binding protein